MFRRVTFLSRIILPLVFSRMTLFTNFIRTLLMRVIIDFQALSLSLQVVVVHLHVFRRSLQLLQLVYDMIFGVLVIASAEHLYLPIMHALFRRRSPRRLYSNGLGTSRSRSF